MDNETTQSLANQLEWCRTTKDYLIDLNNDLHSTSTQYQNLVDELKTQGYMADLLPQIEFMNREFQELSNELIKHIDSEHLAYIEKQSVGIRGALSKVLGV